MADTYTPVNSDASALAQRTITRLATVTGIAGLQNPIDLTTTTGGQLVAIADSYLDKLGYRAQQVDIGGSTTINTTTYADYFGTWTVSVNVAGTYLLHVDINTSVTTLSGGRCLALFQVVVNGNNVSLDGGTALIDMISATPYYSGSWRTPVTLTAGSNTIKAQGKCGLASTAFNNAGNGCRVFTLTG